MSVNQNSLFREFQSAYVKYLNILHRFFVDNGLVYFLSGSTLLGSYLENDFLVNEDSVHLSLLYSDYKKLINTADKLPKDFLLVGVDNKKPSVYSPQLMIKVNDPNYLFKNKPLLTYFIHPIVACPGNEKSQLAYENKLNKLELKISAKKREPRKNRCNWFLWIFYFFFAGNLAKLLQTKNVLIFDTYDYQVTKKCFLFYKGQRLKRTNIDYSNFSEIRYYLFNFVFFFGPKNPEVLIKLFFPDYDLKSRKGKDIVSTMNYLANTDYFYKTDKNKISSTMQNLQKHEQKSLKNL